MRRLILLPLLLGFVAPAAAGAQAEAPADDVPAPGASAAPATATASATLLTRFAVTPGTVTAGGTPARVRFRLSGGRGPVRAWVDLVGVAGGTPVATLRLGRRRTGRLITKRWALDVPAGTYVARFRGTDAAGTPLAATLVARVRVKTAKVRTPASAPVPAVVPGASLVPTATPVPAATPAPAPATGGRFPVRGTFSFGDGAARFGAGRPGHIHQGQDVFAAEGTPIVSPAAGAVYHRAVQDGGAGHYLVIRSDGGPDYVFMHLVAGSELVKEGDRVTAGQPIARVGHTGRADGSHLHFELWPDGWYAKGSKPIDPLPQLKAWAAAG